MRVTLFGIVMCVRLVQPSKDKPPILVTVLGMTTLTRLVQPLNVLSANWVVGSPIAVTFVPIVTSATLPMFYILLRIKYPVMLNCAVSPLA